MIGLLDITKCLYDAIARMERSAEKGRAIAAAVEGVEKQWGAVTSGRAFGNFSRYQLLLHFSLFCWPFFLVIQGCDSFVGPNTFVESLRDQVFRPSLSTIISENLK